MITWQDDEGRLISDLHCKTETDFTESLSTSGLLQTTVEVKKEEDEQEHQDCDSPQESKFTLIHQELCSLIEMDLFYVL